MPQSAAEYLNDPLLAWAVPVFVVARLLEAGHSARLGCGWHDTRDTGGSRRMLLR